jgi:cobalt-zinc-cadmium efflux system protein
MSTDHQHPNLSGRRLIWAFLLNSLIAVVEVAGGILSGSLSLISDALHNVGDAAAVLLAWLAHRISGRPSNERKTFGYKRAEILAALLNGVILAGTTIYLFYEAIRRLMSPEEIDGRTMLIVAVVGLLANLVAAAILHRDSRRNINIRAAYLHLVSDTLSSVAVIVGALLIIYLGIYWVDTLVTFVIGVYIIYQAWKIIRQTVGILMQSAPEGLDLQKVRQDLERIRGIANIHHVHAWNLDDQSVHFECHVDICEDLRLSEAENIHREIESVLEDKYHVHHVTIQFEFKWCHDRGMIRQPQ